MPARKHHDPALAAIVGANAHRLRVERVEIQPAVARRAAISISMLSKIEHGKALPSVPVLVRLAQALDVEPGALLGDLPPVVREAA